MLVAVAFLAAAFWLLETESGLRWALGYAPRELVLEGVQGALARQISAERIAWEDVEARKVSFELNLLALLTDTIAVNFVRADAVQIALQKKSAEPTAFVLPVRIKVSDAQVKSLVIEGYEANDLRLDYTGSALGHEVAATFRAAGARAKLKAALNARAQPTGLTAEVEGLNLAVIDPDLPQTALRAQLEARGDGKTASGKLAVQNPEAGPLDKDRLPLSSAETAFASDFSVITLQNLKASLRGIGLWRKARRASRGNPRRLRCACASSICAACARTSQPRACPGRSRSRSSPSASARKARSRRTT